MADLDGNLYPMSPVGSGTFGPVLAASYLPLASESIPIPFVPVIGSWSPAPGSTIVNADSIGFSVTDPDGNLARVVLVASYAWGSEVIHNGTSFAPGYTIGSTRTPIANGFSYSLKRNDGWSGPALAIEIYAVDSTGQEATPTNYNFTVSDPVPPPAVVTIHFRMRGIDTTCPAIQQPAYVFWSVVDAPDWDASELLPGDLPCGTDPATDVDDIQIAASWLET